MTTNPTIDGVLVPRELLSYWAECLESAGFKDRPAEMRALLDAPMKSTEGFEEWAGHELGLSNRRIASGDYQSFGMACAEKAWAARSAAQPQGEPVAWQYRVSAGPQTGWSLWHDGKGEEFKQSYQVETRPLYAEHPASVIKS